MKFKKKKKIIIYIFHFQNLDLDFWTHPSRVGGTVDIRVTTSNYPKLAKLLKANGMTFTILIPDVDVAEARQNSPSSARAGGFDYNRYNTLDQVGCQHICVGWLFFNHSYPIHIPSPKQL